MKVLVLFYSTYGHVYRLAQAIADGVREVLHVGPAEAGVSPQTLGSGPARLGKVQIAAVKPHLLFKLIPGQHCG